MPASYGEYREAFTELIGTDDAERTWYNEYAGNWLEWVNVFEETGIDFDDSSEQVDAFENFLIAFYPQQGVSDWQSIRAEFYDYYGVDEHNIDWEAYREAIGYG
jgi:hypothetical protein